MHGVVQSKQYNNNNMMVEVLQTQNLIDVWIIRR
jgi:hypothetical protein